MSKPKFKIEASTTGSAGQIRIVDFISMNTAASADRVREVVDDFIAKKIDKTDVYINSRGGSTIEAVEIANELKRLPNVIITVGAVAASAATYIMAKFTSRAYSNSQFMIHRPKLSSFGDVNTIKADLKSLQNTTDDYISTYAAKMGKTEEEIESLFAKGDYWMTAKEAKAEGLLDEIIAEEQQLTAEDVERLVACGAPNIPTPENPKNQNQDHTMKNREKIIAKLGLAADATDEQIEAAIAKATETAAEVEALKDAQAQARKTEGKNFVAQAVVDKKITADTTEKWEKAYEADPDNTKAIIEALPKIEKPNLDQAADGDASAAAREKWTMEDYQEKDPEALATMMVKEPKKFEKLEKEYFNK